MLFLMSIHNFHTIYKMLIYQFYYYWIDIIFIDGNVQNLDLRSINAKYQTHKNGNFLAWIVAYAVVDIAWVIAVNI